MLFETKEDSISLVDKIKLDYDSQVVELIKSWDNFKDVDSKDTLNPSQKAIMKNLLTDLEIEVKVDFDVAKFYDEMYHCIDGAKWRIKGNKEAQKNSFEIRDLDTFFEFLKNKYLEFYHNDGIHSKTFKNKLFDE